MKAKVGDFLVVKGTTTERHDQHAEIIEVRSQDGSPPYVVRWLVTFRRVTGRTIGQYLRTEIAEPLGADSTMKPASNPEGLRSSGTILGVLSCHPRVRNYMTDNSRSWERRER